MQVKSAKVEVAKQKTYEVAEGKGMRKQRLRRLQLQQARNGKTEMIAANAAVMQASCRKDLEAAED